MTAFIRTDRQAEEFI